jgi:hypothetical protein
MKTAKRFQNLKLRWGAVSSNIEELKHNMEALFCPVPPISETTLL